MQAKWFLGIDVGQKKTGVAIGQSITQSARPLLCLKIPLKNLNANVFEDIIREWQVEVVVIGLPKMADNRAHPMEKAIKKLGGEIEKRFFLPVYYVDEYLSSHEARTQFGKRKEYDSAAAAIMLESFMRTPIAFNAQLRYSKE